MNKEYYNNCIKKYIKDLIEEKDSIAIDIENIASYIDFTEKEDKSLSNCDIKGINERRNNIGAIYQLIEDLDKLIK